MDTNMQSAEPKKYTREELAVAVKDSQAVTELIVDMMVPAAAVYASTYATEIHMLPAWQVAGQVFDVAAEMAKRIDLHVQLELARLTQAKEDSGL